MSKTILKIKDRILVLPQELKKNWQRAEVFVFPSKDTLILKKIRKPLQNLSEVADRVSSPPLSQKEINKEIATYRKNK